MYMMFIYIDGKPYNSMGIRGSLEELGEEFIRVVKEEFKKNPHSEITQKITMYI